MKSPPKDPSEHLLHGLLGELTANATLVISGARLARQLKVSRWAVWRAVEHLRRLGVQVRGHPATGYQLAAVPDLLLPELLRPNLRSPLFGRHIAHAFRIDSTQAAAQQAAQREEPEGSLFLAEEQTAGRGRQGHRWNSPAGAGLYLSLLLRPSGPPPLLLPLMLAAGLAVRQAIAEACPVQPDLRWPNDVLLEGKKCAGILLEMQAEATRIHWAVLGIGINVGAMDFPDELRPLATSLAEHCPRPPTRVGLCARLLELLEARYRQAQEGQSAAIRAEFERASSYARDRRLVIGEEPETWRGRSEGLDEAGFLRVRREADGELITVVTGPVRPAGDNREWENSAGAAGTGGEPQGC